MHALRGGFRAVRLRAPTGSRLMFGVLLVHLSLEARHGGYTRVCNNGTALNRTKGRRLGVHSAAERGNGGLVGKRFGADI